MIEINKHEKEYLLSKGCKWHHDIFASTTRRHYYAKEHPWIIKQLRAYQTKIGVKGEG